jgi:hypothetical protein
MQNVYLVCMANSSVQMAPVKTRLSDLIAELEMAEEEVRAPKLWIGKAKALNTTQFLKFAQSNELHYLGCWGHSASTWSFRQYADDAKN